MGEPGFFKQLGLVLLIAALTACSSSSDNTPPPDQPQSTVPDVSGQSQSDAEQAISSATLLVGTITSEASDSVPAGSVIRTQPAAGISVAQNSSVNIILSSGPANVPVPTTAGGSQADAEAAIVAAGFVVGSVDTEASDSVPAGQVIRTVPAAGTEVARGASIDLVVSSGPANIMVPDVTNLTQMAAETAIGNAGLVTGLISTSPSDLVPVGNIISQNPVSGTMVSAGTTVNLTVSLGPANISVPNVVGLAQAQAEMDITGAGLVVGSVTLQADVNVAPGNVISQSPDAMTLAAAATPVDLVVSAGPDAVPVPDIVGLTETEANPVVVNAGLAIGNVTVEFSTTIDRGDVISQSLQPGALVLPDTPLDFVVSAGPPVNVPNV
ncbi:MAG: PASTA domain-containing protein, partial [Pseudomonadota bacterium]